LLRALEVLLWVRTLVQRKDEGMERLPKFRRAA
jgi:hypothetical protein